MAVTLNASTTAGLELTPDTSGVLNIQSGGSTKIAVTSAGVAVTGLSKASLPTGSVLQVVYANINTEVTISYTGTYVTTGLTLSITPTSATSKILIIAGQNVYNLTAGSTNANLSFQIFRNAGAVYTSSNGPDGAGLYTFGYSQTTPNLAFKNVIPLQYLDSPATTSATTYTIYGRLGITGNTCGFNWGGSTITLMEIAA